MRIVCSRAGWQHLALFFWCHSPPLIATPFIPTKAGLKSPFAIPIFLAMHSQAVIRLKRGK